MNGEYGEGAFRRLARQLPSYMPPKLYFVDAADLESCRAFAFEGAKHHPAFEFSDARTESRPFDEIVADIYRGKLGEIGFQKMIKEKIRIDAPLDMRVAKNEFRIDAADFILNGKRIEIKATKPNNRYLMINNVQRERAIARGIAPDAYVLTRIHLPPDMPNHWAGRTGVEIVGFASKDRVAVKPIVKRGDMIPGTSTKAQTDNIIFSAEELSSDFARLIKEGEAP